MTTIKTAVSIDEDLFKEAEKLAEKLNVSRSKLFSTAIKKLIDNYENQQLFENLNKIYSDEISTDDQSIQDGIRKHHQNLVVEKW